MTTEVGESFLPGRECFFRHPEHSWLLGLVEERRGKGEYVALSLDRHFDVGQAVVKPADMAPVVAGVKDHVRDLLHLPYLHDSALLYHVRERYFANHIYTNIGPILLALNPFTFDIPHYKPDQMERYIREGVGGLYGKSAQLPHSWCTAHEAYWHMRTGRENQSILVSGESGAGKTEAVKIVLRYLATCSTAQASATLRQKVQAIADRVEATSPILEAFGNACTLLNDNSSRFGKFLTVQFDAQGLFSGAEITPYLLEKSRVVTHAPRERTYHAFYQVLYGATDEERARWQLSRNPQDYGVTKGPLVCIDGVDDAAEYCAVRRAMDTMGMSPEEQEAVYLTCAGILHLSNVLFVDQRGETVARERQPLEVAARLWGVDPDALLLSLTRKETALYTAPLTVGQATDCRDALCKALYSGAFNWLIDRCNDLLRAPAALNEQRGNWIGLLDIFGFEHFERNSFEQLCINLANEQLQSHYNKCVFERDMVEYRAEGLAVDEVMFVDNQPTLDLLVGRLGVFDLLDSECISQHGTDANYLATLEAQLKNHKSKGFARSRVGQDGFCIKHYAATVEYNVKGFREKNLDTLPDSLRQVMCDARNPIIAELLPRPTPVGAEEDDGFGKRKRTARKIATVSSTFRASLQELMDCIYNTNPHWIRCIKPHPCRRPLHFQGTSVLEQMQCAGVLETIKIRAAGYSVRMPHSDFVAHYKIVWLAAAGNGARHLPLSHLCKEILEAVKCMPPPGAARLDVQIGRKKVFMRNNVFNTLEHLVARLQVTNALRVQTFARCLRAEHGVAVRRRHAAERAWFAEREAETRRAVALERCCSVTAEAEAAARRPIAAAEQGMFDGIFLDGKLQRDRILAKREEMQAEMERLMAKERREKEAREAQLRAEVERQRAEAEAAALARLQEEQARLQREREEEARRQREEMEAVLAALATEKAALAEALEEAQRRRAAELAEAQAEAEAERLALAEAGRRREAELAAAAAAMEETGRTEVETLRAAHAADLQRQQAAFEEERARLEEQLELLREANEALTTEVAAQASALEATRAEASHAALLLEQQLAALRDDQQRERREHEQAAEAAEQRWAEERGALAAQHRAYLREAEEQAAEDRQRLEALRVEALADADRRAAQEREDLAAEWGRQRNALQDTVQQQALGLQQWETDGQRLRQQLQGLEAVAAEQRAAQRRREADLRAAESALKQRQAAFEEAQQQHADELRTVEAKYQQQEEELVAKHTEAVAELQAAAAAQELDWGRQRRRLETELEALQDRCARLKQQSSVDHTEWEALQQNHLEKLALLRQELEKQMAELVDKHSRQQQEQQEAVRGREAEWAQQRQRLQAEAEAARREGRAAAEAAREELQRCADEHEAAAAALRGEHAAQVQAQADAFKEEQRRLQERHEAAVEALRGRHADEAARLAGELATAKEQGRGQREEVAAAMAEARGEVAQLQRRLGAAEAERAAAAGEAAALRREAEATRQQLRAAAEEAVRGRLAAERRLAAAREEAEQELAAAHSAHAAQLAAARAELAQAAEAAEARWQREREELQATLQQQKEEDVLRVRSSCEQSEREVQAALQRAEADFAERLAAAEREFARERTATVAQHEVARQEWEGRLQAAQERAEALEHRVSLERCASSSKINVQLESRDTDFELKARQLRKERQEMEERLREMEARLEVERRESRKQWAEEREALEEEFERQRRRWRAEGRESEAALARQHLAEKEALRADFRREREELEEEWRGRLQQKASTNASSNIEQQQKLLGEMRRQFQRRLDDFEELVNSRVSELHRFECLQFAQAEALRAAATLPAEAHPRLAEAEAEATRLRAANDALRAQLQQTEAAHEKELEAAAERLALATDRHGLERRRLQAQLDKLMEAHRAVPSEPPDEKAATVDNLVDYLVAKERWNPEAARSILGHPEPPPRSYSVDSAFLRPPSTHGIDRQAFLNQLAMDGMPPGEAERLFAALDSSHTGVLDTEDLLRLGDSALAPTEPDMEEPHPSKQDFVAQCLKDGLDRAMAERMYQALESSHAPLLPRPASVPALRPHAGRPCARFHTLLPLDLPRALGGADVTVVPSRGHRCAFRSLPAGNYRVVVENRNPKRHQGNSVQVWLLLRPLGRGKRPVLGQWALSSATGQSRLQQQFQLLEPCDLDLTLIPQVVQRRDSVMWYELRADILGSPALQEDEEPVGDLLSALRRDPADPWPAR